MPRPRTVTLPRAADRDSGNRDSTRTNAPQCAAVDEAVELLGVPADVAAASLARLQRIGALAGPAALCAGCPLREAAA